MALDNVKLRIVAFKDGDQWVAQCLEHDIATQAGDLDTLRSRMRLTLAAEAEASGIVEGNPFASIDAAPDYFQVLWNSSCTILADDNAGDGAEFEFKLAA